MNKGPRKVLGVVVGLLTAFVVVMLIEGISHRVYPPPVDLDYKDAEKMRIYMTIIPAGALRYVLLAWVGGAFAGTLLGGLIAKESRVLVYIIVTGLLFVGAVATMLMFPHPVWFWCAGLVGIPLAGWMGLMLGGLSGAPN